ncbi:MAG TPA: helix-turn-helix transcriptional regulator [Chryseosolibacter sp.]|nr:helix-turn-helix transcriptional regulator [Chryseosolibacter sp.]
MTAGVPTHSVRQKEIVTDYLAALERHVTDLKAGRATHSYEIRDFADILHIHPRHLSNTLHQVLGKSPCDLYEERLMEVARELLNNTRIPIGQIAAQLFFDPSNFTKFFKRFDGVTPKEYRQRFMKN